MWNHTTMRRYNKANECKKTRAIKQTIPWYNNSTDPLVPAMNAHKDQGHGIVSISVRLKEYTSTLMADSHSFVSSQTQRRIIDDVVLDEI